jgi:hypothetical protein
MSDSFAGIKVPEGEPGTVRDAASTFRGLAGGLRGYQYEGEGKWKLVERNSEGEWVDAP